MKVSIIGPGTVGMVLAYTLMLRRAASEIVLIGRNRTKAEGEALDLMHGQAFLQVPVKIRAGDIADAAAAKWSQCAPRCPCRKELRIATRWRSGMQT